MKYKFLIACLIAEAILKRTTIEIEAEGEWFYEWKYPICRWGAL